ncbi:MAG TPA: LysR family transcriptional regulator, partial [Roseiarcus sp.]|nr:LysR family transcriptional regulator [Roseiarcus sp.]
MRGIPIDILRAFVAVVEARGFTRAAEELGRTQPTISLQVKRLEELVEAPLFKKGGRFELSPIGEVCFDYGKRLARLHDDMLDELGRNNPNDAIRIGMSSEFVPILAWRLNELRAYAPAATTFEVIVDSSQALSAAFRQNALDIAFIVGTG